MKSRPYGSFFWKISWLFLAVLLYLSIFGIKLFREHRERHDAIVRKCQERILETELKTSDRVSRFIAGFDTNRINTFRPADEFTENDDSDDALFLFVFRDDSLVYWNNNKVIIPANFQDRNLGASFALRLQNGWYGFVQKQIGAYHIFGSYLIKSEFPFQNAFIQNRFSSNLGVPDAVEVEPKTGANPVYSKDGTFLFNLSFSNTIEASSAGQGIVFSLFILAFLCLGYFVFLVLGSIRWFDSRGYFRIAVFAATIILLRFIQGYFKVPEMLYQTALFGPAWYSSSVFLPSLGDFTLNAICLLMVTLPLYIRRPGAVTNDKPVPKHPSLKIILATGILLLLFHGASALISDLVLNSSVSLNLQNISGLTRESGYGLFIITAIMGAIWILSIHFFDLLSREPKRMPWFPLISFTWACCYSLVTLLLEWELQISVTISFLAYAGFLWYLRWFGKRLLTSQSLLFFLCFFAVISTVMLNGSYKAKEKEQINLLAVKLATRHNPVTEILYEQVERKIRADSVLLSWLKYGSLPTTFTGLNLEEYLVRQYFKDYWKKYQVQITCCEPQKSLNIQPQNYLVNCQNYFSQIIEKSGESTAMPGLFFIDSGPGKEYYLAVVSSGNAGIPSSGQPAVFIELTLKNTAPDPGYPGLLMDNSTATTPDLSDFSYGLYQDGRLVRAVGTSNYLMELSQYPGFRLPVRSFSDGTMIHYPYMISDSSILLISRNSETLLSMASPFPYLFIIYAVIVLIISILIRFSNRFSLVPDSLRNRMQVSLIGILVLTMFAVGIVQVINIIEINAKKNADNLKEKAYSIVVEVQHKFGSLAGSQNIERNGLGDFLVKLSNVFFTDINVFDENGILMASSRPQIFEEGLLSVRMNAQAYRKLAVEKSSGVIHHESIGNMKFNSAYLPFFNDQDQLLGYVNLPYFAKQDEAKKEISSFLVTFINVYILLILFGMFVIVLISNYITAPLATLAEKMSCLRFGLVNEKIPWRQKDEIGQLVAEYNRMIDELGRSAELLARSERESAWREMARQVAHEIKNPLTPMKLSAQYLEKAWKEKAPDWDQRLTRFTKTLVEQIDALSVIASDFSAFAKMPAVEMKRIDIDEVITYVLAMYQDTTLIRFEYQPGVSAPMILADRSQIIRVLTNLLNNAVQAIDDPGNGRIQVGLACVNQQVIVTITDNGCGISPDRNGRIFQPDFTTKTSGMGLGLAIVKGIVETMNGEISFISEENKGTTFTIKFPENGQSDRQHP